MIGIYTLMMMRDNNGGHQWQHGQGWQQMILTMIGIKRMIGMFRTKDGFYGEGN